MMLGYHYDIVIVGKKYHDLMGPGIGKIGHVLSPQKRLYTPALYREAVGSNLDYWWNFLIIYIMSGV